MATQSVRTSAASPVAEDIPFDTIEWMRSLGSEDDRETWEGRATWAPRLPAVGLVRGARRNGQKAKRANKTATNNKQHTTQETTPRTPKKERPRRTDKSGDPQRETSAVIVAAAIVVSNARLEHTNGHVTH